MSIDFDLFCLNFPVNIPWAVVLFVLSNVDGCECPILISVCLIGMALFALLDKSNTSGSAMDTR